MTAYGSVDTAVEALRLGAQDYVLKPIVLEDLLRKIRRLIEHRELAWEIQMLRREINNGTFESGELVGSKRSMQAVNCSAIPDTLLESQLFGYVKGAFTGASTSQEGLFQRANGGTIFLDEIGEMPLSLQPKLLRAIEEKDVLPVGSTHPIRVDVRIIASTNRDLKREVEAGRFREDLYYRLNVINIYVPPLRERREDIPLLVEHLIRRHNLEMKKAYKGADNAAMKILMSLPWKGNIRELDNVLERAMILGNGEWIGAQDLPLSEVSQKEQRLFAGHELRGGLEAYEKSHIENVLSETGGDRTRAAKLLGLSRSSLYRKMERLGIQLD
jgi:DNA-binding NtrC family response regulator